MEGTSKKASDNSPMIIDVDTIDFPASSSDAEAVKRPSTTATSIEILSSSFAAASSIGHASPVSTAVASDPNSPSEITLKRVEEEANSEVNERPKKFRKLADAVTEKGRRYLDILQTTENDLLQMKQEDVEYIDVTLDTLKGSLNIIIRAHQRAAERAMQGVEEFGRIVTTEHGFVLDDDDQVFEDAEIIGKEWEIMTEQIEWAITKVKDGEPSVNLLDEVVQLYEKLAPMLGSQLNSLFSVQQKTKNICSRLRQSQGSAAANLKA